MRVLLTGANGFIGGHLTAALIEAGHRVTGAVRDPAAFQRRFPMAGAVAADLNRDLRPDYWKPRLSGIEAVINCAGILQAGRGQSIEAIHTQAPSALFDACLATGVKRVIQISAISADPEAKTGFALSKRQADDHLRSLELDWVVLRPSLVYAEGSYGGTSLLRALAAMPYVLPMVGRGNQPFQPIHVADLAATVMKCLTGEPRRTLDPAGMETLTMRQILKHYRAWLGLPPGRPLHVPVPLIAVLCRIGDALNAGPLRTTALKQLAYGNTGDAAAFVSAIGFMPRAMGQALAAHPSQAQDLWHARLFLLRPLITGTLVLLWIGSGLLGLIAPTEAAGQIVANAGMPVALADVLQTGGSVLDWLVAGAILFGRNARRTGFLQLSVIAVYTLGLSATLPTLWLDPFGPLLKNLPTIVLVMVWMILRKER